jgi:cytochrome c
MHRPILLLTLAALAGCQGKGDPHAEARALIAARCAGCHTVPGVAGANGRVGPSLAGFANRRIIAGQFANNRALLLRWLLHPQAMTPGGGMPEMGLTQAEAMTIANYLYTLDKP